MRAARAEPGTLFLGVDPVADRLHAPATKAARSGRCNVLFAVAALETLPCELDGLVTRLTVILPWGSLLRGVALPDAVLLMNARRICAAGAIVEVVVSASERDAAELARHGLPPLDPVCRAGELRAGYREAGLHLESVEELAMAALRAVGTTWAKRLTRDGDRGAWRLTARAI